MSGAKRLVRQLIPFSLYRYLGDLNRKYWRGSTLYEKVLYDEFRSVGPKGPSYAYGIFWAARQAKALGQTSMSTIEFGVATGEGLIAMERVAKEISKGVGIEINVFGFDSKGLPTPQGFKDLPFVWREGFYEMDEEQLRKRLEEAELVIGDIKDTVPQFLARSDYGPIGFISVDVDYYSSTRSSLEVLKSETDSKYLPRVMMYFDDVVSLNETLYCEDTGELAAIKEFNEEMSRKERKIHKVDHLWTRRKKPAIWNEKIYAFHIFNHTKYNDYVLGDKDRQYKPLNM